MKIFDWVGEIRKRNALLYNFGWLNIMLFVVCLLLSITDTTTVTGINAWIKPMKFALTVVIYAWTFAWLLHYMKSAANRNFISWGIVVCMLVENVIITLQAARGQASHFNVTTSANALLFATMGIFIAINTFINLYTLVLFFVKSNLSIDGIQLIQWRAGLLLFFLGGISGGLMVTHMGHTFGATDGGPGLPMLNWSTAAGDMRAAHFLTLHGLQAMALVGSWMRRYTVAAWPLLLIFFLYAFACLALHLQALAGLPVVAQ